MLEPLNPFQCLGNLEARLEDISDCLQDTEANPELHRALALAAQEFSRLEESIQRYSKYLLEGMLRESVRQHEDELINRSPEKMRKENGEHHEH